MDNSAAKLLAKLTENPRVRMADPLTVQAKLESIIEMGLDKLLVITDFDFTLSNYTKNGKRATTTHGIFENNPNPERYGYDKALQEQLIENRDKFLKIEFCPTMSMEDKIPYMIEWWNDSHRKVINAKFTRDTIWKITLDSGIELREHAPTFLRRVDACGVPTILFSAGIGDVINFLLQEEMSDKIPNSLHIVANMMQFDEKDICVAFSEPVIHTFNKNSSVISKDAPFYGDLVGRTSVILLGDSLGDVHMDVGIVEESVVLKIGFLNFNADTLQDKYLTQYDIVLISDPTFDVPIALLDAICIKHEKAEEVITSCEKSSKSVDMIAT